MTINTIAIRFPTMAEEDVFFASSTYKARTGQRLFVQNVVVPMFVAIIEEMVEAKETAKEQERKARHDRVVQRLMKEEQERQARKLDHKNGVRPKGMSGQKTAQHTNPNSKKAQKQARKAKASKKAA